MALEAKYLYVVRMDVDPAKETEFNQVYDQEHVPALRQVPGVLGASRYKTSTSGQPRYIAIYELASADVPRSQAFRDAGESGTWPHQIRPYTTNRSHILYERIDPAE